MRQYNFQTLLAFVTRADTLEKIRTARSVIYKQNKLAPWELEELFDELRNRRHIIEKEERG